MTITCAVVDDEPLARQGLVDLIGQVPHLKLMGAFADPRAALPLLTGAGVDLLFLDMRMPHMNGLDLLRSLKHRPATIVVSAHTEHALEGYELDVLDYILKPFPFERFLKAVNKVQDFLALRMLAKDGPLVNEDHFFVKSEGSHIKVRFEDILFVQALENYVIIRTEVRPHICHLTFAAIEAYLPTERFIKVHRSYIVPLAKVEAVELDRLRVAGTVTPSGRTAREAVVARILGDRLLKR